jgi:hypothetical protein
MDTSHDQTDFGPRIPFLGSNSLFSPFLTPKSIYFLQYQRPHRQRKHTDFDPSDTL